MPGAEKYKLGGEDCCSAISNNAANTCTTGSFFWISSIYFFYLCRATDVYPVDGIHWFTLSTPTNFQNE